MRKWKDIGQLLKQHNDSDKHKNAVVAWTNKQLVLQKPGMSIANVMNSTRKEEIEENRRHVYYLSLATLYLARQGLPMRGHYEKDSSANKGNFLELLDTFAVLAPELTAKMQRRYGHYTSPEYQNDLIHCLAQQLRLKTVKCVKFWSLGLLVDESKDVSGKEQLGYIIRYVDKGVINEKPIGAYHMTQVDAASLTSSIIEITENLKLNWNYLIAQCYDGASVMSGAYSGVQTQIRDKAPQAVYVHCHAHRLNLVLVQTVRNISDVNAFFQSVQQLYVFLSQSHSRHELFVQTQQKQSKQVLELERLVDTRWSYWYRSVHKVKSRLQAIVETLEAIESQSDSAAAAEARGLLANIVRWKFCAILASMDKVLSTVHCLSQQLQNMSIDYVAASGLIQGTRSSLINLRTDKSWEEVLKEADTLAAEAGIKDKPHLQRSTRKVYSNSKLDGYFVTSSVGQRNSTTECPQESIKIEIFFSTIDRMLSEFDKRFILNNDVLGATSVFNPNSEAAFLAPHLITILTDHYREAEINTDMLDSQLAMARSLLVCTPSRPLDIFAFRDILSSTPDAFADLLKLVDIVLTLPVTTASNERMFSTLGRVKNYLRSSCGDERLSDLLVLSCLTEDAKQLDHWQVVDDFAKMKSRRFPLMH